MALFRRKSNDEDDDQSKGNGDEAFVPQPEKARKWFSFARTAAESTNYAYAIHCFASGIKLDPETMSAHEAIYEAALRYATGGGKAASSKEIRSFDDGTPIGRFAGAEFAWMKDIQNGPLAIKALESAIKAGQGEWGHWAAPRMLNLLRRSKKVSKSHLIAAKDLFAQVGAWNEAIAAGTAALELDPRDADLDTELKALSAERAMDQGGYAEAAGEEGGYRSMVKDLDRQRELEEDESLSGAASTEERLLLRARKAYEEGPGVPDNINKYAQLLRKQNTPEAIQEARRVYLKGFEETGEYRFRAAAGDLRIDALRRRVRAVQEQIEKNGRSEQLAGELASARQELFDLESSEYRKRVEKYPTDRTLKFQLGAVEFELGNYDAAMECFQKAKDEPKLRVRSGHMLGRCFARNSWHIDAIPEYREALEAIQSSDQDRELEIRYDLMVSLVEHAREERSLELAKEARDICSSIARKDISFRDIRDRRSEVDLLVKEISGGGGD